MHSGLRVWELVLNVLHVGAFGVACSISLLASALFKGRKWEGAAALVVGLALMGYALTMWSQPWGAVFAALPLFSYVLPGLKGLRGKAGKTLVDDFAIGTVVGWVIVVLATVSILVFG
jgi:hypothetical protein